jgi:hypothetical protein
VQIRGAGILETPKAMMKYKLVYRKVRNLMVSALKLVNQYMPDKLSNELHGTLIRNIVPVIIVNDLSNQSLRMSL